MLPMHSKLQITAPKELGLPPIDSDEEMTCWIDSSPFGIVECTFDADTYTFVLLDINPYGELRGQSTLLIELSGFRNRDVAAPTGTFTALTMTEDGYLIDQI